MARTRKLRVRMTVKVDWISRPKRHKVKTTKQKMVD